MAKDEELSSTQSILNRTLLFCLIKASRVLTDRVKWQPEMTITQLNKKAIVLVDSINEASH